MSGKQRFIDANDLHDALGHAHDAATRETANQRQVKVTGTSGYCDRFAQRKGTRAAVAKATSHRVEKPLEHLFSDLAGQMTASTGVARYCLMVVGDFSNMGWPLFLKDKSTATVPHAFHFFLAAIMPLIRIDRGASVLDTDNGTNFFKEEFKEMLVKHGIGLDLSVDGSKLNGRDEKELVLVAKG